MPRRRLPLIPAIQLFGAVFVLWLAFFSLGQALLLIPSEFQDRQPGFFEELDAAADAQDEAETP